MPSHPHLPCTTPGHLPHQAVPASCQPARTPTAMLARLRPHTYWAVLAACLAAATTPLTQAQTGPASDLSHFAREWIDQAMAQEAPQLAGTPLRPEVVIGQLDSRLQLAPCGRIEPYLPKGTQLWGRTRVGLKCMEGPVAWNVFLPVTVKAWGPAWVVQRHVRPGTVLTQADAELVPEVDWADNRAAVLATPEQWVGMQAAYALAPGVTLRQNVVKPPVVFNAGTQVRITTEGPGFQISATGQALTSGQVGQQARVKLTNGRIISGAVQADSTVQVAL